MFKAVSIKNKFVIATTILLSLAMLTMAVLSLSSLTPVKAASEEQATKKTINVTGSGTVSVSPDIAYVTLGVITENKDAKAAQQENAKAMENVVALIKGAGIKGDDIKTVSYNMYPKYDYNKETGASGIIGYQVSNSVRVTVRDIDKAGSIMDMAADSGANMTSNISFGLSDSSKSYNEALKKALEAAKVKAETMAGVYGIKLTVPVTISETGSYNPIYTGISYAKAEMAADRAMTPVESGTMEIVANVSVVYEY